MFFKDPQLQVNWGAPTLETTGFRVKRLLIKMVILGLYWGYTGIMENKMETLGPFKGIYRGYIGVILG